MTQQGGLIEFAQSLIEYVEDLITASPKETFTKVEMLILLNAVKHDPALRAMLAACDQAVRPPTYNG
jgi:hypothetical protein